MLLPNVMLFRRFKIKENYQLGQLEECLTMSRMPDILHTHTTTNALKSKTKTFKLWKDSLSYFTKEQQHSKV